MTQPRLIVPQASGLVLPWPSGAATLTLPLGISCFRDPIGLQPSPWPWSSVASSLHSGCHESHRLWLGSASFRRTGLKHPCLGKSGLEKPWRPYVLECLHIASVVSPITEDPWMLVWPWIWQGTEKQMLRHHLLIFKSVELCSQAHSVRVPGANRMQPLNCILCSPPQHYYCYMPAVCDFSTRPILQINRGDSHKLCFNLIHTREKWGKA